MSQFLKVPGGVDEYPDVFLKWSQGHVPEFHLYACNGEHPVEDNTKVIKKIGLAPYKYDQLHILMACFGFRRAKAGVIMPTLGREEACLKLGWESPEAAALEIPDENPIPILYIWSLSEYSAFGAAVVVGVLCFCLLRRRSQPRPKKDDSNSIPMDEML